MMPRGLSSLAKSSAKYRDARGSFQGYRSKLQADDQDVRPAAAGHSHAQPVRAVAQAQVGGRAIDRRFLVRGVDAVGDDHAVDFDLQCAAESFAAQAQAITGKSRR